MRKIYLGDSVYAEVERGMLKLTTENGTPTDPSNIIYMDEGVYSSFVSWVDSQVDRELHCRSVQAHIANCENCSGISDEEGQTHEG